MKCVICKNGETKPGRIVGSLTRNSTTLVFKDVPAEVCNNCGEEHIGESVTASLLQTAEEAVQAGVRIDVRQYLAT